MAPAGELVDDLIGRDARRCDGAADPKRRAESGADNIRGQAFDVHGIFRAADHLIQPGRTVALVT